MVFVPTISVEQFLDWLSENPRLPVLDIRESDELEKASLPMGTVYHYPLSRWQQEGLEGLPEKLQDKNQQFVVICHHGQRSAYAAFILYMQGWQKVVHLDGGIDLLARLAEIPIPRY